jgi:hypothetical protein
LRQRISAILLADVVMEGIILFGPAPSPLPSPEAGEGTHFELWNLKRGER